MSRPEDFIIENDVLNKYVGSEETVTEISDDPVASPIDFLGSMQNMFAAMNGTAPAEVESEHPTEESVDTTVPAGVLYPPGEEPERIKRRLDTLFPKLDEAYPDKVIVGLHKKHREWGRTVTDLYRKLGYPDGNSFLRAYGYTVDINLGGRPKGNPMEIVEQIKEICSKEELTSIKDLKEKHPELKGKIHTLENEANNLFGMSLARYLEREGILQISFSGGRYNAVSEDEKIELGKAELEKLKLRYPEPSEEKVLYRIEFANKDINWNLLNYYARTLSTTTKSLLIEEKIMAGITEDSLVIGGEEIDEIVEILKKRYEGKSYLLPRNYSELNADNKDIFDGKEDDLEKSLYKLYKLTPQAFFRNKGLISRIRDDADTKLSEIMPLIKENVRKYGKKVSSFQELERVCPGLPIKNIDTWTRSVYGKPATEYLYDEGVFLINYHSMQMDREERRKYWEEKEAERKRILEEFINSVSPLTKDNADFFVEKYVEVYGMHDDVDGYIKSGVRFKGSDKLCSVDFVKVIFSEFMKAFDKNSYTNYGAMSQSKILSVNIEMESFRIADMAADIIEKDEFVSIVSKMIYGPKYRFCLMPFTKYNTDKDKIEYYIGEIKYKEKGRAKERYWAESAYNALLLSDSPEAVAYIDSRGDLDDYAEMRNVSAQGLRDAFFTPKIEADGNVLKTYKDGNLDISVRINDKAQLELYDNNSEKVIRSFPKEGTSEKTLAEFREDYDATKKSTKNFLKEKRDNLCRLHITGETIEASVWNDIYCNHPLIKVLSYGLVWMDSDSNTFVPSDNGVIDAAGNAYQPKENVKVANVIELSDAAVQFWQEYFVNHDIAQPFEQIWEPRMTFDVSELKTRYSGLRITSKERNDLKKALKSRGVDVYSDKLEGEYNPYTGYYEYPNENWMHFGDDFELHYVINEEDKSITFDEGALRRSKNKNALNCICYELGKLAIRLDIQKDNPENLTENNLNTFTASQIMEFIDTASACKSANCSALLIQYKEKHYPDVDPFTMFVLDI